MVWPWPSRKASWDPQLVLNVSIWWELLASQVQEKGRERGKERWGPARLGESPRVAQRWRDPTRAGFGLGALLASFMTTSWVSTGSLHLPSIWCFLGNQRAHSPAVVPAQNMSP